MIENQYYYMTNLYDRESLGMPSSKSSDGIVILKTTHVVENIVWVKDIVSGDRFKIDRYIMDAFDLVDMDTESEILIKVQYDKIQSLERLIRYLI